VLAWPASATDAFVARSSRAGGARVELARYPDHHAYTAADAARSPRAARGAARAGARVVTTLKDAVKLGPLWPRGAVPLWYVSQRVTVERGADALAARLDDVAAAARAAPRRRRRPDPARAARGPDLATMATDLRLPTAPIVLPDKDRFLNEDNPFEAMMSRFDRAAVLLDLDPGIYQVLRHPEKQITISVPVMMDSARCACSPGTGCSTTRRAGRPRAASGST
jgi:hypothetical protein